MKNKVSWENIFPAICIPLNDDYSINEAELRAYVRWLADFDEINGLVVNGHTGEITSFSRAERKRAVEIVADEVGDRVSIISGVHCEGTLELIEHAKDARDAGADGILLMPPHIWLRFGMSPQSPVELYKRVAEAVPELEIIIHLYPYGTKGFYPIETVLELAKIPQVKAIKMGTRHMGLYERDIRILREKAPDMRILTCHDEYLLLSMYAGVDGALIGFAGCIPELICEAWKALKKGDFAKTVELEEKIFPMSNAIYGFGQPSGEAHARMKEAIYQRGIFSSPLMREPVQPLFKEEIKGVTNALKAAGYLK